MYPEGWLLCWKKELELLSVELSSLERLRWRRRRRRELPSGGCSSILGRGLCRQLVALRCGVSR